jgi:RHH-type rel operon transcriptional repressor/antitoxin RelB
MAFTRFPWVSGTFVLRYAPSVLICTQLSTNGVWERHVFDNGPAFALIRPARSGWKLAKSTGRSRSFLAAQAINEYLDLNEWQVAGIQKAMVSLDRDEGVAHERVKEWVSSWDSKKERPAPKRSAT